MFEDFVLGVLDLRRWGRVQCFLMVYTLVWVGFFFSLLFLDNLYLWPSFCIFCDGVCLWCLFFLLFIKLFVFEGVRRVCLSIVR